VTADFRFVTHAAQRNPHKFPPDGACDGFAERSFTNPRRTHQANDGALELADARLDRQILDDPLLDLLQTVMVVVEDTFGGIQIDLIVSIIAPGQRDHPVDIVAHHSCFGRHRRHHLELFELLDSLVLRFFGHLLGEDLFFEFLDLVLEFVFLAELLLDGPHLLVEIVLFLSLLHLLFDPGANPLLDFENFDLRAHEAEDLLQTSRGFGGLEQAFLVFDLDAQMRHNGIGQTGRLGNGRHRHDGFGRDLLVQLDVILEGRVHAANQSLDLGGYLTDLFDLFGVHEEKFIVRHVAFDACAFFAFDQNLDGAVGKPQQLHHSPQRAHIIDIGFRRFVGLGVFLGSQQNELLLVHRLFKSADRTLASYKERDHHMREYDNVAKRQQWNAQGATRVLGV